MVEVSKKNLWKIVNKKINKLFDAFHVLAIINILFEEMAKDLFAGKRIIINNFGVFKLKKVAPRMYVDINSKKNTYSPGNKMLRLKLKRGLNHEIIKNIDLDKTFGSN